MAEADYGLVSVLVSGTILVSGQTTTHFRVRADSGDKTSSLKPKIDEFAILGNLDNPIPPLCIVLGDRKIEFPERVEENLLLAAAVKKLKLTDTIELYELQGLDHVQVANPAGFIIDRFSKKISEKSK